MSDMESNTSTDNRDKHLSKNKSNTSTSSRWADNVEEDIKIPKSGPWSDRPWLSYKDSNDPPKSKFDEDEWSKWWEIRRRKSSNNKEGDITPDEEALYKRMYPEFFEWKSKYSSDTSNIKNMPKQSCPSYHVPRKNISTTSCTASSSSSPGNAWFKSINIITNDEQHKANITKSCTSDASNYDDTSYYNTEEEVLQTYTKISINDNNRIVVIDSNNQVQKGTIIWDNMNKDCSIEQSYDYKTHVVPHEIPGYYHSKDNYMWSNYVKGHIKGCYPPHDYYKGGGSYWDEPYMFPYKYYGKGYLG